MLKFTQQANKDLSSILAGLISFRIDNAIEPALSIEHAERIFDDIANHIATIPKQRFHRANTFAGLLPYGQYVYSYRRNKTNWYAFYDRNNGDFVVNRITNNWNLVLPIL